ncbi:MAG TPA: TRAP transporter small permease subunit [Rhodospirillales bacterium]|nr:TRAP transporter small permease subunit [Rhodospirillales bacterium]
MDKLEAFARAVDRVNEAVGRAVSWLTLAMVLTTFAVAVLRYGFDRGLVWLQESYVWMHGLVFMLGAGYTLRHDGHVRIDVFYRPAGLRYRAWVDLLGSLLLLMPLVLVLLYVSLPYVADSWSEREGSREAGGLPGLFLLKTAIPLFAGLVGLQGLSLAAKAVLALCGRPELLTERGAADAR